MASLEGNNMNLRMELVGNTCNEKLESTEKDASLYVQSMSERTYSPINICTTTCSSDIYSDINIPAFPIKDNDGGIHLKEENRNDANKKQVRHINGLNAVIREDKEKRKVIVEWYNNNELCSKQWSCKKFGKEGAAKRALQFLERMHGIPILCTKQGFYPTLFGIGLSDKAVNVEGEKEIKYPRKRRKKEKTCDISDSSAKVDINKGEFLLSLEKLLLYTSFDGEEQICNFNIDKIPNNYNNAINDYNLQDRDNNTLERYKTINRVNLLNFSLNKRLIFRKLLNDIITNKEFSLDEIINTQNDFDNDINYKNDSKSLFNIKTVRELLQKTVRNKVQHDYTMEDFKLILGAIDSGICQPIINNSDKCETENIYCNQSWNNAINTVSRLSDDLYYLFNGGHPGYTLTKSPTFGSGYYRSNQKNISNTNEHCVDNMLLNYENTEKNKVHPSVDIRRVTRQKGRTDKIKKYISEIKEDEQNRSCFIEDHNQVENAICTLLDIKYKVNSGKVKQVFKDLYINPDLIGSCSLLRVSNIRRNIDKPLISDDQIIYKEYKRKRKNNIEYERSCITNVYTKSTSLKKRVNLKNKQIIGNIGESSIEWSIKPRGWKVSYYKGEHKCYEIFKIPPNLSYEEQEMQYKRAYKFYQLTMSSNDTFKSDNCQYIGDSSQQNTDNNEISHINTSYYDTNLSNNIPIQFALPNYSLINQFVDTNNIYNKDKSELLTNFNFSSDNLSGTNNLITKELFETIKNPIYSPNLLQYFPFVNYPLGFMVNPHIIFPNLTPYNPFIFNELMRNINQNFNQVNTINQILSFDPNKIGESHNLIQGSPFNFTNCYMNSILQKGQYSNTSINKNLELKKENNINNLQYN
ncbi:uncharacterized protein CMU_018880 [Cryptosporidium muris RN66]|uniref:Uncharacterized protein n=1 Tax=Cryptosporidium muris (strain RN66) TaxID=441375 RepID=B6AC75_CRYMR|nr:uncharacterized protein CMU_018880 [Cryptosporidium muris RN66]EEA06131.1 hypothetical protein, conserved [Cryptosporidium muris RN66]|eukprot:XP_002140480.1 hypothetical protein [Cryptosporidium muris RN66]